MPRYEDTWTSLAEYPTAKWFRDAKFGIYTHWGPYSVPAFGANGSWYTHHMYNVYGDGGAQHRHHCKTYGGPEKFGYKDFIPMFTAEKFDPEEWAEIFHKSGARFAGPVAEHHDGFSMWDSKLTKWNAAAMGPKRDVVGELERAIRGRGMRFITTFHHAMNWWFFPTWNEKYDCSNPEYKGLYSRPHPERERRDEEFLDIWLGKLKEVVERYRPDLVWFDGGLGDIKESYRREFLAYYYNKSLEWDREVVVTYKHHMGQHQLPPNVAVLDLELGKLNEMAEHVWLTDSSIDAGSGWSHVKNLGFKSVERLVHNLVDRVSKNGYLLLNVGPRADGTIPLGAREALEGMGRWLEVNGDAIYDTTPWLVSGEGPTKATGGGMFSEANEPRLNAQDIRFTTKGRAIYAVCMGRPGDEFTSKQLNRLYPDEIDSIDMLGGEKGLEWRRDDDEGLTITVPEKMPCEHAVTFRVNLTR